MYRVNLPPDLKEAAKLENRKNFKDLHKQNLNDKRVTICFSKRNGRKLTDSSTSTTQIQFGTYCTKDSLSTVLSEFTLLDDTRSYCLTDDKYLNVPSWLDEDFGSFHYRKAIKNKWETTVDTRPFEINDMQNFLVRRCSSFDTSPDSMTCKSKTYRHVTQKMVPQKPSSVVIRGTLPGIHTTNNVASKHNEIATTNKGIAKARHDDTTRHEDNVDGESIMNWKGLFKPRRSSWADTISVDSEKMTAIGSAEIYSELSCKHDRLFPLLAVEHFKEIHDNVDAEFKKLNVTQLDEKADEIHLYSINSKERRSVSAQVATSSEVCVDNEDDVTGDLGGSTSSVKLDKPVHGPNAEKLLTDESYILARINSQGESGHLPLTHAQVQEGIQHRSEVHPTGRVPARQLNQFHTTGLKFFENFESEMVHGRTLSDQSSTGAEYTEYLSGAVSVSSEPSPHSESRKGKHIMNTSIHGDVPPRKVNQTVPAHASARNTLDVARSTPLRMAKSLSLSKSFNRSSEFLLTDKRSADSMDDTFQTIEEYSEHPKRQHAGFCAEQALRGSQELCKTVGSHLKDGSLPSMPEISTNPPGVQRSNSTVLLWRDDPPATPLCRRCTSSTDPWKTDASRRSHNQRFSSNIKLEKLPPIPRYGDNRTDGLGC